MREDGSFEMIRCTLELVRLGDPDNVKHLGTIEISNQILDTIETKGKRGSYLAHIYKMKRGRSTSQVVIKDFPRLSYHPWNLIRRILNEAAKKNGGTI
jgi:hypothetical protein